MFETNLNYSIVSFDLNQPHPGPFHPLASAYSKSRVVGFLAQILKLSFLSERHVPQSKNKTYPFLKNSISLPMMCTYSMKEITEITLDSKVSWKRLVTTECNRSLGKNMFNILIQRIHKCKKNNWWPIINFKK